jgi:hypothetical protein
MLGSAGLSSRAGAHQRRCRAQTQTQSLLLPPPLPPAAATGLGRRCQAGRQPLQQHCPLLPLLRLLHPLLLLLLLLLPPQLPLPPSQSQG